MARSKSEMQQVPSDLTRMFFDLRSRWAIAGLRWPLGSRSSEWRWTTPACVRGVRGVRSVRVVRVVRVETIASAWFSESFDPGKEIRFLPKLVSFFAALLLLAGRCYEAETWTILLLLR